MTEMESNLIKFLRLYIWEIYAKVNGQNQKATGPLYLRAPMLQVAVNRSMRLFNRAKCFSKESYFLRYVRVTESKLFAVES